MTKKLSRPAKVPCASCPYRKDVPSGIWAKHEYEKLLSYDGPTWQQSTMAFNCHQRTGELCAGWVGCHGPSELLALRVLSSAGTLDPATFDYVSPVPLFESGRAAMKHGLKEYRKPSEKARRLIDKLRVKLPKRSRK